MARSSFFATTGRVGLALLVCLVPEPARGQGDAERFLEEADRLAWLRVWSRAEPLYAKAHEVFVARGDKRNAIYAEVSQLRGKLPTLSVPEVSERLSQYLDDSIVQSDERLRLRVLVIKAETDEDLDPGLSQRSWTEALSIAEKLGEPAWANRARGELGLVAFLLGDTNTAIVNLGQAIKVAEASGDTSSLVRWLTLFGHGYVELNRPSRRSISTTEPSRSRATIPELQLPVMTFLGKADALVKLGRLAEAEELITSALAAAEKEGVAWLSGGVDAPLGTHRARTQGARAGSEGDGARGRLRPRGRRQPNSGRYRTRAFARAAGRESDGGSRRLVARGDQFRPAAWASA